MTAAKIIGGIIGVLLWIFLVISMLLAIHHDAWIEAIFWFLALTILTGRTRT